MNNIDLILESYLIDDYDVANEFLFFRRKPKEKDFNKKRKFREKKSRKDKSNTTIDYSSYKDDEEDNGNYITMSEFNSKYKSKVSAVLNAVKSGMSKINSSDSRFPKLSKGYHVNNIQDLLDEDNMNPISDTFPEICVIEWNLYDIFPEVDDTLDWDKEGLNKYHSEILKLLDRISHNSSLGLEPIDDISDYFGGDNDSGPFSVKLKTDYKGIKG